jgi:hypothetical protein
VKSTAASRQSHQKRPHEPYAPFFVMFNADNYVLSVVTPSMLPDTHLDLLSLRNSINPWNLHLFIVIIKPDDLPNTGTAG